MVAKVSTRPSAAAAAGSLASSSAAASANGSSVLRSAFAPSRLRLALFASVVQGLDAQRLRIHDTLTDRVRCEHSLGPAHVASLDWGYHRRPSAARTDNPPPSKKKKKTKGSDGVDGDAGRDPGDGDVVVAVATGRSDVHLYSPSHASVVLTLRTGHVNGVRQFRFRDCGASGEAWSLGGDGTLVQWSLEDASVVRSVATPAPSLATLLPLPSSSSLLCAAGTTYLVDPDSSAAAACPSYAGGDTVHSLLAHPSRGPSGRPPSFLAAADANRNVTLFDVGSTRIKGLLIAEHDVESLALSDPPGPAPPSVQALAAVTRGAEVELFASPFDFADVSALTDQRSIKAARRSMTRRSDALIRVRRPGRSTETVPIVAASFDGDDILLALVQGGTHVVFQRVRWRDGETGEVVLSGPNVITRAKALGLDPDTTNGAKDIGRTQVDDSRAVFSRGGDAVIQDPTTMDLDAPEAIEADEEREEDGDDVDDDDDDDASDSGADVPATAEAPNGLPNGEDADMTDAPAIEQGVAEAPSFGDLLRAKAPEVVDVGTALREKTERAPAPQAGKDVGLRAGVSLGVVLAQSLRTNDRELLEGCFHVQDPNVVRATIERLDPELAGALLEKLAERLHDRPGRAGSLMVWVQWTLVAHGGFLAAQPAVARQLRGLYGVVRERAMALQPLLSLKGKLDMLEAQLKLRRSMQDRPGGVAGARGEEDDEEGVIYVEGQEEDDDDDDPDDVEDDDNERKEDEEGGEVHVDRPKLVADAPGRAVEDVDFSSDGDDGEAMPITTEEANDDDEDDEEDSGSEGFIDDEAEESDLDSDDGTDAEDGVDYDDVDSADEDQSEGEAPPTTTKKKRKRKKGKAKPGLTNGT